MRFVNVSAAKGLKVGEQVFTLNEDGEYGVGRLDKKIETASGLELTFEIPQYFNPDAPAINPVFAKNITHVCVQKNRKLGDDSKE